MFDIRRVAICYDVRLGAPGPCLLRKHDQLQIVKYLTQINLTVSITVLVVRMCDNAHALPQSKDPGGR